MNEVERWLDYIWTTPGHGFATLAEALRQLALAHPEEVAASLRKAVETE